LYNGELPKGISAGFTVSRKLLSGTDEWQGFITPQRIRENTYPVLHINYYFSIRPDSTIDVNWYHHFLTADDITTVLTTRQLICTTTLSKNSNKKPLSNSKPHIAMVAATW